VPLRAGLLYIEANSTQSVTNLSVFSLCIQQEHKVDVENEGQKQIKENKNRVLYLRDKNVTLGRFCHEKSSIYSRRPKKKPWY